VIGPGGRKEHGPGPVLLLPPPLREDKGEEVGRGGVSMCGRLLERLEGKEWVEQREQEAGPKEVAAWEERVLWVKKGEGKPGGVMGVVVVVREWGQEI
jgi:hypothetical protein